MTTSMMFTVGMTNGWCAGARLQETGSLMSLPAIWMMKSPPHLLASKASDNYVNASLMLPRGNSLARGTVIG